MTQEYFARKNGYTGKAELLVTNPALRRISKDRYKIEAKNSEIKHAHGYDRAKSYGISDMELQGAVILFVVNLKRIMKIMGK